MRIVRTRLLSIFILLSGLLLLTYWLKEQDKDSLSRQTAAQLYSEQCFAGPHQKQWDDRTRSFCFYYDQNGDKLSESDAEARYERRKDARSAEKDRLRSIGAEVAENDSWLWQHP
ncbi:hypothetical protein JVX98_08355 [Ensifer sp. PDNC004]|uniref:hypothetical protein n=1 Tax=unclassified Ensifer TaxID=2633371 RepID=UPI001784E5E3|nr:MULTISPECIES: hypothetical protein [unclassified Ensifer]MBD9647893.1 hypothetical protein [Ensifer sp. ENS09]QRY68284.1 hypothetical protein JVX98_08355 [Ensifer sp. PDNC004]